MRECIDIDITRRYSVIITHGIIIIDARVRIYYYHITTTTTKTTSITLIQVFYGLHFIFYKNNHFSRFKRLPKSNVMRANRINILQRIYLTYYTWTYRLYKYVTLLCLFRFHKRTRIIRHRSSKSTVFLFYL